MKICFCSIAFRTEPIEEITPRLAEIGYSGVEVWYNHICNHSDEQLFSLAKTASDSNIDLEVISPYLWLTQDQELLERSFGIAKDAIDRARKIGACKIRTFTDSGPTGIGSDVATKEQWDIATRALKKIAAMAPDIDFVVETHAQTLADTPKTSLRLIEAVGAKNLKINYQPAPGSELSGYELLRPHIVHMHLHNQDSNGNNRYLEEGGALNISGLLHAAFQDNYSGSVSVEYCWKGVTWDKAASAIQWLNSQQNCFHQQSQSRQ